MKIKPNLQFSVLCDDVRREDNGKFILVGLFETINARKFPATHHALSVANRWCKGQGSFTQKIRIVHAADNALIFQTEEQPFLLGDIDAQHTVLSKFGNLIFPKPGKYWVEVLLDNELFLNYPIVLKEIKHESDTKNI